MFKKKCSRCNNKIDRNYSFCPFCGKNFKSKYEKEDFGFLGKEDFINSNEILNIGDSFIERMLNKVMKMMEKQMRETPREAIQKTPINSNMRVQFFVNGKKIFPQKEISENFQKIEKDKKRFTSISKQKAERFAKLPRKEPKTIMKRLGEKLIYELSLPGVTDIEDVLINQLENSIEIKALSKNKVYLKILNVNLPILSYELNDDNLILELQAK